MQERFCRAEALEGLRHHSVDSKAASPEVQGAVAKLKPAPAAEWPAGMAQCDLPRRLVEVDVEKMSRIELPLSLSTPHCHYHYKFKTNSRGDLVDLSTSSILPCGG